MGPKNKKQRVALPAALAASLWLLVIGGVLFVRYLARKIYEERTAQLVEITSQVQVNLNNAFDTQWSFLITAANILLQEQADLRKQGEMNAKPEQSNALLAESKDAVEQALQIAEEANRAKSSFLSNMSHDIRTPMNAVIGFSTLLARDAENPEKVREYTKKITSSSQHLLGLIDDIPDISKIEAGNMISCCWIGKCPAWTVWKPLAASAGP